MKITKEMLEKLVQETLQEKQRVIETAVYYGTQMNEFESGYNTGLMCAYKRLLKRLEREE